MAIASCRNAEPNARPSLPTEDFLLLRESAAKAAQSGSPWIPVSVQSDRVPFPKISERNCSQVFAFFPKSRIFKDSGNAQNSQCLPAIGEPKRRLAKSQRLDSSPTSGASFSTVAVQRLPLTDTAKIA
jgi:hypothetical protein